jgi:hypothetical protein
VFAGRVLSRTGEPDPGGCVAAAWRRVLVRAAAGECRAGLLRAELVAEVFAALRAAGEVDDAEPAGAGWRGSFLPAGDRWAGWWDVEPAGWPPGATPSPAQVLAALRGLPVRLRVLLLLREAAGVPPARAGALLGIPPEVERALTDQARTSFVGLLDTYLVPDT